MDFGAYVRMESLQGYVEKHYGMPPRPRGIRLMKVESKVEEGDAQFEMYNSFCGEDVIMLHTRCGTCGLGEEDSEGNYRYCGMDEYEEDNAEYFVGAIDDGWDSTYRDTYLKAVVDDEYKQLIASYWGEDGEE